MSEAYECMIKKEVIDGILEREEEEFQIVDELKGKDSYQAMKRNAENRDTWRNHY